MMGYSTLDAIKSVLPTMMGDIPCLYYSHTLHQSAHTNTPTQLYSIKPQVHTPGNPINFELFGGFWGDGGGVGKNEPSEHQPQRF
jgi:hypothetical protein